jgi:hypothetical protein
MDVRGSVTILLMLLMPLWLLLGGVVLDRATFYHAYRGFVRENELKLAAEFRAFDRSLFDRFGLLGVKARCTDIVYDHSLGEREHLEHAIVNLMRHRAANDLTVMGAESLISDQFIGDLLKIREEVDETIALKDAINRKIARGEVPQPSELGRLISKVVSHSVYLKYPYQDIHEILSLADEAVIELEVGDVLKDIQWEYFELFSELELDEISEKYLLSEYVMDYLGYSSNLFKQEIFTAEYVLTGLCNIEYQKPVIQSELVMVRTIMNAASLIGDTEKMKGYLILAGGDVKLQLIYLLADALKMGIKDMSLLIEGKPVPLYKSPIQLNQKAYQNGLYYRDYLEIMLMVEPRKLMLERIEDAVFGTSLFVLNQYYTGLRTKSRFTYQFHFFGGEYEREREFSIEF